MKPPIFSPPAAGSKPQQYMHLARMFREAALGLPAYRNNDVNWPTYALLLHATELVLKAFCDHAVANGMPNARAPNHDLKGWYAIALQHGLPADQHVAEGIDILAELHSSHYARYPDNRRASIPDISIIASDVVDRLISIVTARISE
ncbi:MULTISPECIES: hypothetical protein [Methylosinus]|uniref:HEPN domain-containing protein n=1 Tax=Methylosinus sporium TaxID=428 RepID=A0A549T8K9_METSR|nr:MULTISPECIES: hypothetical protein [Methylosinus]MBU3889882.1 hypothetical protein [Methylosinus sp. KRF6]TRL38195.1 hypothetical protein FM996_00825 [Methylosinus sporium]